VGRCPDLKRRQPYGRAASAGHLRPTGTSANCSTLGGTLIVASGGGVVVSAEGADRTRRPDECSVEHSDDQSGRVFPIRMTFAPAIAS